MGDPTGGRRARPPPSAKYPAKVLGKCFGALFKDLIFAIHWTFCEKKTLIYAYMTNGK
jgi:hypothetical protein